MQVQYQVQVQVQVQVHGSDGPDGTSPTPGCPPGTPDPHPAPLPGRSHGGARRQAGPFHTSVRSKQSKEANDSVDCDNKNTKMGQGLQLSELSHGIRILRTQVCKRAGV